MSNLYTQIFRLLLVCVLIFGKSLIATPNLGQQTAPTLPKFRVVKADRWGILNKSTLEDTLFDRVLDQIVASMSLEEKVGQMTQIDLGVIAVGEPCALTQPVSLDAEKLKTAIEKYHIGSILNVGCGSGELNINEWKRIIAQIKTAEIAANKLKNSGNNAHIPIFYGIDAIHGANYTTGATLFPQQIAQAATWNPEMVKKAAEATAREVRASGLDWNFSPVVDLARQPLWSRYFETFGEDVFLNQILVKSMISGYQGANGLNFMNSSKQIGTDYVAACLKHFLGYGMPLSGKDRTPAWIPERELREYYLPGFQKAIEMGAMTLMINSGEINGTPVHINYDILTKLLRHELNFKGIAVTDWEDIYKLHHTHKVAASIEEAVKMAINAGIDMSMTPNDYQFTEILIDLVKKGDVPMWRIEESVKRILRVKHKAGIFVDPESQSVFNVFNHLAVNHSSNVNSTSIQESKLGAPSADKNIPRKNKENTTTKPVSTEIIGSPAHQQLALSIAEESITLLKNEQQALPLRNDQQIILFGDAAHNMNLLNGAWTHTWQGDDEKYRISTNPETPTLFQALSQQHSKVICLCDTVSGKSDSVTFNNHVFGSKKYWKNLDKMVRSNTVAVLSLGEKPGTEIPGNINDLNLELSESNKQLFDYFKRKNIPVVLILNTGRPRIVTSLVEKSDAVLQAYLSGDFGGKAISNTLLGKNNPNGKLPYTYPRFAGDIVHYDHKHTEKNDTKFGKKAYNPLFDFGHGLSYTEFEYKNFKVIAQKLPRSINDSTMIEQRTSSGDKSIPLDDIENGQLTRNWEIYGYTVDIDITNTGKVAGRDVIQIYLSDEFASITPSAKRLVAFEKTSVILPNETQHYRLFIELEQLSFINKDLKRVVEKGDFTISVNQLSQTIYFPENIEIK